MLEFQNRREEYLMKGEVLYAEYMNEHKELMKHRRLYSTLDYGVKAERELNQRYNRKVALLAEEYKDVL